MDGADLCHSCWSVQAPGIFRSRRSYSIPSADPVSGNDLGFDRTSWEIAPGPKRRRVGENSDDERSFYHRPSMELLGVGCQSPDLEANHEEMGQILHRVNALS